MISFTYSPYNGLKSQIPTLASKLLPNLAHCFPQTLKNLTKIKDSFRYTSTISSFLYLVWAVAFSLYFQCFNLTNPSNETPCHILHSSSNAQSFIAPHSELTGPITWVSSWILITPSWGHLCVCLSLLQLTSRQDLSFSLYYGRKERGEQEREWRSIASNLTWQLNSPNALNSPPDKFSSCFTASLDFPHLSKMRPSYVLNFFFFPD